MHEQKGTELRKKTRSRKKDREQNKRAGKISLAFSAAENIISYKCMYNVTVSIYISLLFLRFSLKLKQIGNCYTLNA